MSGTGSPASVVRSHVDYKGVTLDPFQERAIGVIEQAGSLLLAAPTGSGKTLVAEYAIEHAVKSGKRAIYTSPNGATWISTSCARCVVRCSFSGSARYGSLCTLRM